MKIELNDEELEMILSALYKTEADQIYLDEQKSFVDLIKKLTLIEYANKEDIKGK